MSSDTTSSYRIEPWLSVRNSAQAVEFYKAALGAVEIYRIGGGAPGVVVRFSVHGAQFWVSEESPEHGNFSPESAGGGSVRMILSVPDPDATFAQALRAGAKEIHPVVESHGWRIGRICDPYGHHWEIGRALAPGA